MKVTRDEQFTPITIVLETREEALILWHLLNVSGGEFEDLLDTTYETPSLKIGLWGGMWDRLNEIFTPKRLDN